MEEEHHYENLPRRITRCTDKYTGKKVLARGFIILIDYMEPTPIVDMMLEEEYLKFSACRDITELPLTTEKNRAIIMKISQRGEEGYANLKRFLNQTKQTVLVDYLEHIENGEDTTAIIETLQKGSGITDRWKGVQDELLALYKEYYVKTELSPLMPGSEIHVDDLYVPLQMEEAHTSHDTPTFPSGRFATIDLKAKRRKEVKCFRDMLYEAYEPVNTVYVIADPGVGKTTFCRKLVSVWCKAHSGSNRSNVDHDTAYCLNEMENEEEEDEMSDDDDSENVNEAEVNLEEENVETLRLFDFLFFISLRHTSDEAKIEDMIKNQLKIDMDVLQSILSSKELKCLVILDGLDEWSAPLGTSYSPYEVKGFPKTDNVSKCQILVTTRPWKLLSLTQTNAYKHKEINVIEMKIDNSKRLISLFLKQRKNNASSKDLKLFSCRFLREMRDKELFELSTSPLVLKLLLCLWLESGKLKTSICQIYGAVIDLLIERGLNRNKEDQNFSSKMDLILLKTKPLAECFKHSDFENLNRFSDILLQLSKLSFNTLFCSKEDSKLIFRDRDLKLYDLDLELCSQLGILSQRPVIGKSLLYRERTVAFLHKSFQEFYAAVYMSYSPEACLNHIKEICNSPGKLFEVSNVFQFVGGICPSIITQLCDHIRNIDNNLDSRHPETEHTREMFSNMICNIATESVNCNSKAIMLKINHLSVNEDKFSKCLAYVSPKELKGLSLRNIDLNHTQIRRLLTGSPHLKNVSLNSVKIVADRSCECSSVTMHTTDDESLVENLTVVGSIDICPHMQRYRSLQELHLCDANLMHIQITYLLSDSVLLRKVYLNSVNCKKDRHCRCNLEQTVSCSRSMSVFNLLCRCFTTEQQQIPSVTVTSYVEALEIIKGGGMFKHIHQYPRIQEITIISTELTHTEILHLLTDSRNLRKVKLKDIICAADITCGCLQSHQMQASSLHCISYMETCEIALGSDIFKHIQKYARLQTLCLVSIKLNQLEITTLLTTSSCLNTVRLKDVTCDDAVRESGFKTARKGDSLPSNTESSGNSASVVKMCTMMDVSGIFSHIRNFPDLYELDIGLADLTHTEVTCLLTTSSRLRKVRLDEINCRTDSECGCPTESHSRVFAAEICTIEGGCEMFAHIDKYPRLQDLKLHYVQLTYQKLANILCNSPNLQKVSLAGLEHVTNITCDRLNTDDENLNFFQQMRNQILYILREWPRVEGLLVTIEDIDLVQETADALVREVEWLEKFEILYFSELKHIESGGIGSLHIVKRFNLKLKVK